MAEPYNHDYPGTPALNRWDVSTPAMRRWFEAHAVVQFTMFPDEDESLAITAIEWTTVNHKRRVRFIGIAERIDADGKVHRSREIEFDHAAPPPPFMYVPAARPYIAPTEPREVRFDIACRPPLHLYPHQQAAMNISMLVPSYMLLERGGMDLSRLVFEAQPVEPRYRRN